MLQTAACQPGAHTVGMLSETPHHRRVQAAGRTTDRSAGSYSWLPFWLMTAGHEGDLSTPRALKRALKTHGVHAQGLRLYRLHGDLMFAALGPLWVRPDQPAQSLRAAVALLRLLQDANMASEIPFELIRSAVKVSGSLEVFEQFPVALFRSAWREIAGSDHTGSTLEALLVHQIEPILGIALNEWLQEPPDHNQVKQGWSWVRKRYGNQALRHAKPRGKREWNTPFTRARFGGFDFLPLFNTESLVQEGQQMEHCIADYCNPRTLGRTFHAFSIRRPGSNARVATLSLEREETGTWVLDGLSGRCNTDVGEEVKRAAESFVSWMNRAKSKNRT